VTTRNFSITVTVSKQPRDQALIVSACVYLFPDKGQFGATNYRIFDVSKLKFHVKPQLFLFQRKHFRTYLSPLWGWLKQQEKNFMHTWIYFREQIICEQPSYWVRFEGCWRLSRITSAFVSENCKIHFIFSMERIVSLQRLLSDSLSSIVLSLKT